MQKQVEVSRIKRYTDWFFEQHVLPHFQQEEQYLFPVLGETHPLVKRALAEHRRLTRLFTGNEKIKRNLSLLEEELEGHIRFEERILFQKIQEVAAENQLDFTTISHPEPTFEENTEDVFWKTNN
ncbi:MAG: hemerythrin domain-containing protein [Cyclobacteriaceae bacterium]